MTDAADAELIRLRAENAHLREQFASAKRELAGTGDGTIAQKVIALRLQHGADLWQKDMRINAAEARAVAAEAQVVALQEAQVATTDLVMNSACVDGLDFDEPWIMTAIAARAAVAARKGQGAGGARDGGAT